MAKYGVPPSTDRPNERATNLAPLLPPRIECAIHSRQRGRRSKRMRMHMPFLQVQGRAGGGGCGHGRLGRFADDRGLSVYGSTYIMNRGKARAAIHGLQFAATAVVFT